jgi:hypothetical protein
VTDSYGRILGFLAGQTLRNINEVYPKDKVGTNSENDNIKKCYKDKSIKLRGDTNLNIFDKYYVVNSVPF